MNPCDLLLAGTGSLAEAALFSFATTGVGRPLRISIGGRNAERCRWLALAANARAAALSVPNFVEPAILDWSSPEALEGAMRQLQPKVVVQTASMQSPWALAESSAWSQLIRDGGYGLATPFHTILTARLVRAIERAGTGSVVINGAYPDLANSIIKAMGLTVPLGFGNVDIVATSAAAMLGSREPGKVRMLAQWEPHVADFREPPEKRRNINPKAWIDGEEVADFMARFRDLKFPPASDDSLNQITGTTVVPMAHAFLTGQTYVGHAAGPFGLPGGYPVRIDNGEVSLNLPDGISREDAIAFNKGFEQMEGIVLDEAARRVTLTGHAHEAMASRKFDLAEGYPVASLEDLEIACTRLDAIRGELIGKPAS
ncbi:hypothetical protein [Oceanibacterium hippocampi]|uniref:Saccharopine dehydrogenase NADP binding domain-containing protein n=1 Tax=Oceanibacterium hippocampi TaxID=745714 RepID=A0A1Y5TPL3_9PROT|nr:hypothetical protein [Oceanibacterium hippocampi]SLN65323.1 hypothetical protein OCH7691_02984 [Oceanibacterium hippocampi]